MTAKVENSRECSLRTIKQVTEERPYVNERWLRRLIYERRIRFYKVRGRVLVALEDLDAMVENGRVEPAG